MERNNSIKQKDSIGIEQTIDEAVKTFREEGFDVAVETDEYRVLAEKQTQEIIITQKGETWDVIVIEYPNDVIAKSIPVACGGLSQFEAVEIALDNVGTESMSILQAVRELDGQDIEEIEIESNWEWSDSVGSAGEVR